MLLKWKLQPHNLHIGIWSSEPSTLARSSVRKVTMFFFLPLSSRYRLERATTNAFHATKGFPICVFPQ